MNATTVNQFAQRCDAIAQEVETLRGNAERVRAFAQWLRDQGRARHALHMRVCEFMARCPATVRDAARAVVREALDTIAAPKTPAKAAPVKKARRKCKAKAERTDLMSVEDYAEMLRRMDPFEAARIQREE